MSQHMAEELCDKNWVLQKLRPVLVFEITKTKTP